MTNFSNIASNLIVLQPVEWNRIILYIQMTESSYEMFFYSKINNEYVRNFDFEKKYGVTRKEMRDSFKKIYEELLPDYQEKKWYVCTFIINADGQFTIEYEYNDYSENSLEYKQNWKDKFLNN